MKVENRRKFIFAKFSSLSLIGISFLSACSQEIPSQSRDVQNPSAYLPAKTQSNGISNRITGSTESIAIDQVLGSGYLSSNITTVDGNVTGAIGNAGGFGFNGSIGSIIGNIGGFGFGGFGTFASFFAGSLPSAPPGGILIPPGVGAPPGLGGFGPPPGSFSPPIGGFVPPGLGAPPIAGVPPGSTPPIASVPPVTGIPPGLGNGGGVGNGVGAGNGAGAGGAIPAQNNISINNTNLSELQSPLAAVDLDILLVSPLASGGISARALTETIVPCVGGGTITQIVDDVDPPGLSSGDSRSTLYTDCASSASGVNITNGSRGFITEEIVGTPFVSTTWISRSTMFRSNFIRSNLASSNSRTTDGSTTTGISVIDNNFVNQRATGSGTSSRVNSTNTSTSNHQFDLDFNWDVAGQTYTIVFNVSVESVATITSGTSVETLTPIAGTLGLAPISGQLSFKRLTDTVVSSIVLATAQVDGTVLVEVDSDADGIIDSSTIETDWSGVLFNIFNS